MQGIYPVSYTHRDVDKRQEVESRTYRASDRQKEFVGILKSYDENTVTITYEDETEQTFDRKEIALIRQALDF